MHVFPSEQLILAEDKPLTESYTQSNWGFQTVFLVSHIQPLLFSQKKCVMIQYLPGMRGSKRIFAREKYFSKSSPKEICRHFGKLYMCKGFSEQLIMCIYLNISLFIYDKKNIYHIFQINIFIFEGLSPSEKEVFHCLQDCPFENEEIAL